MRVCILTLGCIIARLEVRDRDGKLANVVLGLDSVEGYAHRSRVGTRIYRRSQEACDAFS
jgi:hypothetical protein